MGRLAGMADPDDERWGDQDRDVGDGGTGMPRVRSGCALSLCTVLLVVVVSLLGLALAAAVATLLLRPTVGGALTGVGIALLTSVAVCVAVVRGRAGSGAAGRAGQRVPW